MNIHQLYENKPIQTMQALINQLSINYEEENYNETLNYLKNLIDFIDTVNQRFC